jgi:hypothetical protein
VVETRDVITRTSFEKTATAKMVEILADLYQVNSAKPTSFEEAQSRVYDEYVRPYLRTDVPLVNPESITKQYFLKSSLDSEQAQSSLLTLLGVVCILQGDQGSHIFPYLQARQFLQLAMNGKKGDLLPEAHNALGNALGSILKLHADYVSHIYTNEENKKAVTQFLPGFETSPLEQSELFQLAYREYSLASDQGTNDFIRARSLNNLVDLWQTAAHRIYIDNDNSLLVASNLGTSQFVTSKLALPSDPGACRGLELMLGQQLRQIDEACRISRESDIFFTRAQLLAVGGEIAGVKRCSIQFWADSPEVCSAAVDSLSIAKSLHSPLRYFGEQSSEKLNLGFLWTRCSDSIRKRLEGLAQ